MICYHANKIWNLYYNTKIHKITSSVFKQKSILILITVKTDLNNHVNIVNTTD